MKPLGESFLEQTQYRRLGVDVREATRWPRGSRARPPLQGVPPASWSHGSPPPLIPAPTLFFFLPKNHYPAQARVLAHFAAIFDLLAQSTSHKTA